MTLEVCNSTAVEGGRISVGNIGEGNFLDQLELMETVRIE